MNEPFELWWTHCPACGQIWVMDRDAPLLHAHAAPVEIRFASMPSNDFEPAPPISSIKTTSKTIQYRAQHPSYVAFGREMTATDKAKWLEGVCLALTRQAEAEKKQAN